MSVLVEISFEPQMSEVNVRLQSRISKYLLTLGHSEVEVRGSPTKKHSLREHEVFVEIINYAVSNPWDLPTCKEIAKNLYWVISGFASNRTSVFCSVKNADDNTTVDYTKV